jgi:hypothetical protein
MTREVKGERYPEKREKTQIQLQELQIKQQYTDYLNNRRQNKQKKGGREDWLQLQKREIRESSYVEVYSLWTPILD